MLLARRSILVRLRNSDAPVLTGGHSCNTDSYMRRDSRLSGVLHVLLHMAEQKAPVTSEALAKAMDTNAVVIRRIMSGLRDQGYVRSEKGHGGGWTLARELATISLRDVYEALGQPVAVRGGKQTNLPAVSSSRP